MSGSSEANISSASNRLGISNLSSATWKEKNVKFFVALIVHGMCSRKTKKQSLNFHFCLFITYYFSLFNSDCLKTLRKFVKASHDRGGTIYTSFPNHLYLVRDINSPIYFHQSTNIFNEIWCYDYFNDAVKWINK